MRKKLVKPPETFSEIKKYEVLFKDKIHNLGTIHELYFDESDKDLQRFYLLLCVFHDKSNYAFRGQRKASWKLSTTWHRTFGNPTSLGVKSYLAKIEKSLPQEQLASDETIEKLMLAQHHMYHTPLLDFSYHPYKALHFAFKEATPSEYYSTVYILLRQNFCNAYTGFLLDTTRDSAQQIRDIQSLGNDCYQSVIEEVTSKDIEDEDISQYIRKLTIDKTTKLSQLAENRIYMIPNQPNKNERMSNQEGLFIYDMQHYSTNSLYGSNFEDFISQLKITDAYKPVLIKAHINRQHACAIRKLLDDEKINNESLGLPN